MTFDAKLYTLLHRGVSGDLDFYTRFCTRGSRVLELGSGNGRISQALAEAGRHVTGLETNPGMLSLAQDRRRSLGQAVQERLQYQSGDIRDFDIEGTFDYAIMPFTTIFCLNRSEKKTCFKRTFEHLKPGGAFALDTYDPQVFDDPDWENDDVLEPLTTIIDGDRTIAISEMTVVDPIHQIARVTYGHQIHHEAGRREWVEYAIEHYYCSVEELTAQLKDAGFVDIESSTGFSQCAGQNDDERVVLQAKRPESLSVQPARG